MTRDEIMKELIEIFQDEFDDESLKICQRLRQSFQSILVWANCGKSKVWEILWS